MKRKMWLIAAASGVLAMNVGPLFLVAPDAVAAAVGPGQPDSSFGANGTAVDTVGDGATGVALLPGGDLVVSGDASQALFRVTDFSATGAQIATNPTFAGQALGVATTTDRPGAATGVVAAGYGSVSSTKCAQGEQPEVVEYPAAITGQPIWSQPILCSTAGVSGGELTSLAVDPATGDIYAAGFSYTSSNSTQVLVTRLTPGGTPDTTFAAGGFYQAQLNGCPSQATGVALDPATGDVVVTGTETCSGSTKLAVLALTTTGATPGSLDTSFATNGVYVPPSTAATSGTGVVVVPAGSQAPAPPSGTIFVSGDSGASSGILVALNPNGTPYWTTDPATGSGQYTSVTYQPDGATLTVGGSAGQGPNQEVMFAQYQAATGALNASFGAAGTSTVAEPGPSSLASVASEPDGSVVGAGQVPGGTQGTTAVGLVQVLGPSVSVTSPPMVQFPGSSSGTQVVDYNLTINEPLYSPVTVSVCGSGGFAAGTSNGCTQVTIPAGSTSVSVPINMAVNYTAGNQQTFSGGVQASGGVTANPSQGSSSTVVQHIPPPPAPPGYWLVASDGGIFSFSNPFYGSTGAIHLNQPIVGMAATPNGEGYWLVAADGGVFSFGDAQFYGSTGNIHLNQPIVGMAATPNGGGYWLVAADGGIFSFGDAQFYGSTGNIHLNQPIVGMAATPDGGGYWLVAADGGIFSFGDAPFLGSTGNIHLNQPIVGMAAYPGAPGYWLVAADGGIFSFGDAPFYGSTGNIHLNKPIVGMAATPTGGGYWMVASDGGIFSFGNAPFYGSTGNIVLNRPVVGMGT